MAMGANGVSVAQNAAQKAIEGKIAYTEQNCKRFVERCVADCGGKMSYKGSNDMFRNGVTWLGTLAKAKAEGKLVKGALLFIHAFDGGEPSYYTDGKGNASHVGIYCDTDGIEVAHSSASKGKVCPSTLKNGWAHVGLAKEIDYEEVKKMEAYQAEVIASSVNLRKEMSTTAARVAVLKKGTQLKVDAEYGEWVHVIANGKEGYVMREFIGQARTDSVTLTLKRSLAAALFDALGEVLVNE